MSPQPVASYLIDFGRDSDIAAATTVLSGRRAHAEANSTAARIEAAHARGLESGKAAGRAELERRLEEQNAAHQVQLATVQQAMAGEVGAKLADELAQGLAVIERTLAESVARILQPVLAGELRHQAIVTLRTELERLLHKDAGAIISITGPEDVLHAMRATLAGRNATVTYVPGDGMEVRINAGHTVIETRLAAWLDKIQEAMR